MTEKGCFLLTSWLLHRLLLNLITWLDWNDAIWYNEDENMMRRDFMIFRESETVELKKIVVDDIKKEIVAFANGDGGTLYVGVADDGEISGAT